MADRLKRWARSIKGDLIAVYFAACDTRVPWYAKVLALCVAGYALSPIDLVPDFVPFLGYLDDVVIVPLGIIAVVKLIPPAILAEHRAAAAQVSEKPVSRTAAGAIVLIWVASTALVTWWATATSPAESQTEAPPIPSPDRNLPGRWRHVVRVTVLALTAVETALFLVLIYWGLTEGPTFKIMTPIALAAAIPYVLFVVPALCLALMGRLLWAALALSLLPVAIALYARF